MQENRIIQDILQTYGDVIGIAKLGDTFLVVVKEGDKMELLIKASKLWEKHGADVYVVTLDGLRNLHPELVGEFEVLYDTDGFLFETLSKMIKMKGFYPTLRNLKRIEVVNVKEVEKCRE